MPPDEDLADPDAADLRVRFEAERAAAEYWRHVAAQRSEDYVSLRQRPAVRALLGVERRLAPIATRAEAGRRRLGTAAEWLTLRVGALRRIGRRPSRDSLMAAPGARPASERRVALVLVGATHPERLECLGRRVEVTRVAEAADTGEALARVAAASNAELVGVVAGTSEPVEPDWLDRLAVAIGDTVVAAVPLLVHPLRSVRHATVHDGLVRAAGFRLRLDATGTPRAEALAAGTEPRPDGEIADVDAGCGAAFLVERGAYEAAGGLAGGDDLDAAVVELSARLRAQGGRVVLVPAAVVVDHRPVRTRRALSSAVDPTAAGWGAAIDRSGPVLRRVADQRARPPRRWAVTVAAPSAKVASRWGDWHLADALAASLRRRGQDVVLQTADRADDTAGRSCDIHLVLRGLHPVRPSAGQRQVLWVISHPEMITGEELAGADLVLAASPRFADHLRARTDTPVDVLLQATDHRRFRPRPPDPAHRHDVTIVAKSRDVLRPIVADAVAAGLRPHIYGGGWRGLVDPELVVADHVDNDLLPTVYSSAGVVLTDHWGTMRAWGFVSNRLFDVLACGAPVISDPVEGLDELFDGTVLEYGTPAELRDLVDRVLADPAAARARSDRGRRIVVAHHTFDHRADQLLDSLSRWVESD
jgi:Glycosyl transferases group 1